MHVLPKIHKDNKWKNMCNEKGIRIDPFNVSNLSKEKINSFEFVTYAICIAFQNSFLDQKATKSMYLCMYDSYHMFECNIDTNFGSLVIQNTSPK